MINDVENRIILEINDIISTLPPSDSLKFLFSLDNRIYQILGRESIRYGNGIHTKHKHIKYHDFFIDNINPGSRVLDIGCGNGALTSDIADKVRNVTVHGIDLVQGNVDFANNNFARKNVIYVCGDALKDLPDSKFDVITMSNVMEHIESRVDFLKALKKRYNPRKILIRVPIFERDWRVPLQQELGMDYRLDSTHFIEYRQEEFWQEMKDAGLKTVHYTVKWGEIWAEMR